MCAQLSLLTTHIHRTTTSLTPPAAIVLQTAQALWHAFTATRYAAVAVHLPNHQVTMHHAKPLHWEQQQHHAQPVSQLPQHAVPSHQSTPGDLA